MKPNIVVSGAFDDLHSQQVRLLEEAARLGHLNVLMWSDQVIQSLSGRPPKFPQEERLYLLQAIRYVEQTTLIESLPDPHALPRVVAQADVWVVDQAGDAPQKRSFCQAHEIAYRVMTDEDLKGFPVRIPDNKHPWRKKVVVTGCYDWLHSGHVRFFEEASEHGDLYVIVGNDANVRYLKGEGHPMLRQDERRYMAQSIRFVTEAWITSGWGWIDAEPEIDRLKPDIYLVNEDGDKPEKVEFCRTHQIEYMVLKRLPRPGLTRRSSTDLRGF